MGTLVLFACLITTIAPLLDGIELSPDSVNFIVAAQNLMEHGELFVFSNWPSKAMEPVAEPFTDYPPGYALYICPFLVAFDEPFLAAAIAQGLAVVLLFGSVAFLFRTLRLPLVLRVAGYLLLALLNTFQLIAGHYWTEPLFIALTLTGGAFALRGMCISRWSWWWAASLCFFLASSLKFIGVFNLAWLFILLLRTHDQRWRKVALVLGGGLLPVLLWFIRNQLRYGRISYSHLLGEPDLKHTLLRPLNFVLDELLAVSFAQPLAYAVLLAVCFLLLLPWLHRGPNSQGASNSPLLVMTAVWLVHSLGIWALSLVTFFSILDDRLLSPSIALGIVALLCAIDRAMCNSSTTLRVALATAPFLFILSARHVTWPPSPLRAHRFSLPKEADAWADIHERGLVSNATHFYSDRDFRHQLFARIPQRILWDTSSVAVVGGIATLLHEGAGPFFVMHKGTPELRAVERGLRSSGISLERIEYGEADLVVLHGKVQRRAR